MAYNQMAQGAGANWYNPNIDNPAFTAEYTKGTYGMFGKNHQWTNLHNTNPERYEVFWGNAERIPWREAIAYTDNVALAQQVMMRHLQDSAWDMNKDVFMNAGQKLHNELKSKGVYNNIPRADWAKSPEYLAKQMFSAYTTNGKRIDLPYQQTMQGKTLNTRIDVPMPDWGMDFQTMQRQQVYKLADKMNNYNALKAEYDRKKALAAQGGGGQGQQAPSNNPLPKTPTAEPGTPRNSQQRYQAEVKKLEARARRQSARRGVKFNADEFNLLINNPEERDRLEKQRRIRKLRSQGRYTGA